MNTLTLPAIEHSHRSPASTPEVYPKLVAHWPGCGGCVRWRGV
jgi:hypothetical protein